MKVWVVGFWKLKFGVIFLYSDATWQINLTQQVNQNPSMHAPKDLKKGKEGAVLLDKYGIGWWLKPKTNRQDEGSPQKDIYSPTNTKNNFMDSSDFFNSNGNFGKNNKLKNGLQSFPLLNSTFNPLAVRIGRKLVSSLKQGFIKEFEDMM